MHKKKKRMKRTDVRNVRKIWDMVIGYSICVIEVPEGEERERVEHKKYFNTFLN